MSELENDRNHQSQTLQCSAESIGSEGSSSFAAPPYSIASPPPDDTSDSFNSNQCVMMTIEPPTIIPGFVTPFAHGQYMCMDNGPQMSVDPQSNMSFDNSPLMSIDPQQNMCVDNSPLMSFDQQPNMCYDNSPLMSIDPQSNMNVQQSANRQSSQATIENIDADDLTDQTFGTLINLLLGGPGGSATLDLELRLGIGGSLLRFGKAFGGIILRLNAGAEIDGAREPNGNHKFKISGGVGIGGYVRAEISSFFQASAERLGNINLEGEFESVEHFSRYVYNRIVNTAQRILNELRDTRVEEYIPETLISLANGQTSRIQGPTVTRYEPTQTNVNARLGEQNGPGVGFSFAHEDGEYTTTRDGRQLDHGRKVILQGSRELSSGTFATNLSFKHTEVTSDVNEANNKEELELSYEIQNVANRLDEVGCQRLTNLVERTGNSVSSITTMAATAGSSMISLISGGGLYAQVPSVPDLEINARGTLQIALKMEKGANQSNFTLKMISVNFIYTHSFEGSISSPIPGTVLSAETGTNFTAQFVRPIYVRNIN